jgi:hypothetical protein
MYSGERCLLAQVAALLPGLLPCVAHRANSSALALRENKRQIKA